MPNNGESSDELLLSSEGSFLYYRSGAVTPGTSDEVVFSGGSGYYRSGAVTPGTSENLLEFSVLSETAQQPLYYQRVYDATLGWCYYKSEGAPDPSPPANATSPNHTGSISDLQILNVTGISDG